MFTTRQLQDEIIRLKKEKDICILAHSYQSHDITEIADFVGDSYGLSLKAASSKSNTVIMCGVRFMAQTIKIMSPDKRVILSAPGADCPMAHQISAEFVKDFKKNNPDYAVVAYINTTAELKAVCDACVTSSSALNIVKNIKNKNILFIPDCNLGQWIAHKLPEKNIKLVKGGCPSHLKITTDDVKNMRLTHPGAKILIHPECHMTVSAMADFIGSTTEIMDYAKNSDCTEFIIGTENNIVSHLQFDYPEKKFYALSKECICKDMRLTTLCDVYNCLNSNGGEEIILSDEIIKAAKSSIDNMIKLNS